MADNNKLELVVDVDVNKANASIKSVNTGLSSMAQAAAKAARGASPRIDGFTARLGAPDRAPTRLPSLPHWLRILTQVRHDFRDDFGLTVRGPRRIHCALHVTVDCGGT